MLEDKMDKQELNNKVDKEDLKRVKMLVEKRISDLKFVVQKEIVGRTSSPKLAFEPLIIKETIRNKNKSVECFSCGNEVQIPSV